MITTSKKGTFRLITFMCFCAIWFTGCKGNKKASQISDTQKVSQQVKEEMAVSEEAAVVEEKVATENVIKPAVSAKNETKIDKLDRYFQAISSATTLNEANNNIDEALTMFPSGESVVLIEIYRDNNVVDYDEPTSIFRYLNYLKDTKSTPAKIQDVVYDDNGKIKELVLRKYL